MFSMVRSTSSDAQVNFYSPGNLTRGRRQRCPLSIPDKKNQQQKATLEISRTRAAFTYSIGILFISSVNRFTSAAFLYATAPRNHIRMYFRAWKTFLRLAPGNRNSAPMVMVFSAATMQGSSMFVHYNRTWWTWGLRWIICNYNDDVQTLVFQLL